MKQIILVILLGTFGVNAFAAVLNPLDPNLSNNNQIQMPSKRSLKSKWIGKVQVVEKGIDGGVCLLLTGRYAVQQVKYDVKQILPSCPDGIVNRFYKVTAMVKGEGEVKVGVKSVMDRSDGVKRPHKTKYSKELKLTDSWQTLTLSGQEVSPYATTQQVLFRLSKGSKAYVDKVRFQYIIPKDITFTIKPQNIMATPGEKVSFKVEINKPADIYAYTYRGPLNALMIDKTQVKNGEFVTAVPKTAKNSYKIIFSAPSLGVNKIVYVHVAPLQSYKQLNDVASSIKIAKPLNILIIGDSLSDFFRGYNYVDMLDQLLNKYNPGKVSIRNVGVGGDFITRVWKRVKGINGKYRAYRQYMYNDLLSPKPDLIFIFLGANDSKCLNTTQYKIPNVPLKEQKINYEHLLSYLQKKTDAKVVLIECPSFNPVICARNATKLQKLKRRHNKYGIKKAIIDFNNVNKKLVEKYKLGYINLFDITNNHPQQAELFLETDGVHLTGKGSRLLTLEILKYIKQQ